MPITITRLLIFTAIISLVACTGGGDKSSASSAADVSQYQDDADKGSSVVKLDGDLFSIPSPIQSAIFIKENGSGFREDLLLPANELDAYQTGAQKAIALGIYGAQLGYISLYKEDDRALSYMNTSRKLGDDIGISGAFTEDLVRRFSDNMGTPDSMVVLVSDIYEAADSYLKGNERNDIAAMVLFGGWMESLYVTCQEAKDGKPALRDRIAEQKPGFERLKQMLSKYKDNKVVSELEEPMAALQSAYDQVESNYVYQRPVVDLATQTTILKGELIHKMDEGTMADIIASTEVIRSQLTGKK